VTSKKDVEKAFGASKTLDDRGSFLTYETKFGKVNVAYSTEKEYIAACSCIVPPDVVLSLFISPKDALLSDLQYDLSDFERDDVFSPREISYFNARRGILIATTLVELCGRVAERVIAVQLYPPESPK
jgi:hypothetical protein